METTTLSLQIQSEDDMVRLLSFLHDTKMKFRIEDTNTFERYLYQAIDGDKVNPAWLRNSIFDNVLTNIEEKLQIEFEEIRELNHENIELKESIQMMKDFRKLVNKEYHFDSMKVLYKPTEYFKEFCGGEWLTPKGLISAQSALKFLETHIKTREIRVVNGVIYTTEWLRNVLQDTRDTIFYDELPVLVNRLLKK